MLAASKVCEIDQLPIIDWVRQLLILKRARDTSNESPLICNCAGFLDFGGSNCKLNYNPENGALCSCGILASKMHKLEKSLDFVLQYLDNDCKM